MLTLAVAALLVGGAAGAGPRPAIFDVEADCSATPPAEVSVSGVTDDGHEVTVEVGVLLDGIGKARARDLLAQAGSAYAPLNVRLEAAFYKRIRIVADQAASGERRATVDGGSALTAAKTFFGGKRPDAADVVHVFTDKDVTLPNYGSTLMGAAECAGGVQYDDKAFSITEDPGFDTYSVDAAGLTNVAGSPAEAVAHEIGHLLGGLHEHKSCAEGVSPGDATSADPSPCTVMSDVVDLASLRFGAVEAAVVRGYALRFADS